MTLKSKTVHGSFFFFLTVNGLGLYVFLFNKAIVDLNI